MRQSQLNRQVARATGESISTIKRLGFLCDRRLKSAAPGGQILKL